MKTSPPPQLANLRILIVEDKALVAIELERMLTELKCQIVGGGPVPRLQMALRIVREQGSEIDGALLDINLNGDESYPIAEQLESLPAPRGAGGAGAGVPFILMTGYGSPSIPAEYRHHPRLTKPFGRQELIDMMVKVFVSPPEALAQSSGAVKTD